jgi:hypothetical protein
MDGGAEVVTVAVLDVGKSNVKLSACTATGRVVGILSTPNPVCPSRITPLRRWSFLRVPSFAGLVAALRPGQATLADPEPYSVAAGAALLCRASPEPVPLSLIPVPPLSLPGLSSNSALWRRLTGDSA